MYRHGRKKTEDEVEELTLSEFRAVVLKSIAKLNNKDTFRTGRDELIALVEQLQTADDSLIVFMVFDELFLN